MHDPLLVHLARLAHDQAADALSGRKATASTGYAVRPRPRGEASTTDAGQPGRIDAPGKPLGWGERGVFELTLPGDRFVPRTFYWPSGTILYRLEFEGMDPIVVNRSHFQQVGWYGFKLPTGALRGGSRLRIYAGITPKADGPVPPEFIGILDGQTF